mmetsp:Transcript_833/g.851  ORF Transcript_833/g.851 Transcript_833/m.851 type:complete len:196 (-) Transcript_833:366-953(-)
MHPLLLDVVEQLLGSDFCLVGAQIFCKPAGDGVEVPMHQDVRYGPIQPVNSLNVWVALDCSDAENGCLCVHPKSHSQQHVFEHVSAGENATHETLTQDALTSLEPPVNVELEPGQFSLHDRYLVHGSKANVSARRRAGVVFRYMPTTSLWGRDSSQPERIRERPVFLARGIDRCGKNKFTSSPWLVSAAVDDASN